MPVYTLTARIMSGGQVVAVKQAPFLVNDPDGDLEEAARDLEQAAKDLEEAARDLQEAAEDESHPKHHWWRP